MQDRPGLLGVLAGHIGVLEASILEVSHGRLLLDVPTEGVSVDVTIETRNAGHRRAVLEGLAADGFAPQRLDRSGMS